MDHFAGMDVSVKETGVCILDDAGKIVKEMKVASAPQALPRVLGVPSTTSSGTCRRPNSTALRAFNGKNGEVSNYSSLMMIWHNAAN
jgi:hypothetical protein